MGTRNLNRALTKLARLASCSARSELLVELSRGTARVCDLAESLELDRSLVSHHLQRLKTDGMVERDPGGAGWSLCPQVRVLADGERLFIWKGGVGIGVGAGVGAGVGVDAGSPRVSVPRRGSAPVSALGRPGGGSRSSRRASGR